MICFAVLAFAFHAPPTQRKAPLTGVQAPRLTGVPAPTITAALGSLFSAAEVAAIEPQLAALNASLAEVVSRVAQAQYLLAGCADPAEATLVRTSLVQQAAYLTQPFAVAYEDRRLLVVDKPFDTQIFHGTHQLQRYEHEVTVSEWASDVSDTPPGQLRPAHQLDFGTSGLLVLAKDRAALSAATARRSAPHRTSERGVWVYGTLCG